MGGFIDFNTGNFGFVSYYSASKMFSAVWSFASLFFSIFDKFNASPLILSTLNYLNIGG